VGHDQCAIRLNRSTTNQILCIRHILKKKWEYNETVHQQFIDFKKVSGSVRGKILYNNLIEFGVLKKLVRLSRMCFSETYSKVRTGKHLSDSFRFQNRLKQGDTLTPLFFKFALEYAIRKV
jgi:hypothetical protein